jgi:hypothetical protein
MNYADFSVGKEGLELLRFQAAAYRMLVDEDPLPDYEGLDWGAQSQHVFRDNLRVAASRLIDTGTGDRPSVIDYATFIDRWPDPMADKALSPLARIFNPEHATLAETPVFWVRVVGYAFVCRNLLMEQGRAAGFATPALDVNQLLATVTDEQIRSRVGDYPATFERIIAESL